MTAKQIAGAVLALLLSFCFGYALRGDGTPEPSSNPDAAERESVAPAFERYTGTAEGAAKAAADHLRRLGDEHAYDDSTALLTATVAPELRDDLEESLASAAARLGDPAQVISRIGVLGTQVEDFDESRAVVSVWHVAVAGSTDAKVGLPVQALWRTARLTLVRDNGTWLIADGLDADDVSAGPVPAFSSAQPAVSSADDLGRVGRDFQGAS